MWISLASPYGIWWCYISALQQLNGTTLPVTSSVNVCALYFDKGHGLSHCTSQLLLRLSISIWIVVCFQPPWWKGTNSERVWRLKHEARQLIPAKVLLVSRNRCCPQSNFEKQPSHGKLMLQNCVGKLKLASVNSTKAVSKLVASIPLQRGGKKVLKGGRGRGQEEAKWR